MKDCVFCKIIKKEIPSEIVFEDSDVIVFKNIEPVADVHVLICPKQHVESFLKINNEFNLDNMVKAAQKMIKDLKIESGYKLCINGGKYQSVPHLHWHLLAGNLEKNDDIINNT